MIVIKITLVGIIVILGLAVPKLFLPVVWVTINVIRCLCLCALALDSATRVLSFRIWQRMEELKVYALANLRLLRSSIKRLAIPNKANRLMYKTLTKIVRYYHNIINLMRSYVKVKTGGKELKLKNNEKVIRQLEITEPNIFNCRKDFYNYRKQLNGNGSQDIVYKAKEKLDETVVIDVKAIVELVATNKKSCEIGCNNCNYMKNAHCPNCISCMLEREGYCNLSKQCSFNLRKECKKYYSDECELRKSLLFPD